MVVMVVVMKIMIFAVIATVTLAPVWRVKTTSLHGALWPNAA
jgi:hypothetical protein